MGRLYRFPVPTAAPAPPPPGPLAPQRDLPPTPRDPHCCTALDLTERAHLARIGAYCAPANCARRHLPGAEARRPQLDADRPR